MGRPTPKLLRLGDDDRASLAANPPQSPQGAQRLHHRLPGQAGPGREIGLADGRAHSHNRAILFAMAVGELSQPSAYPSQCVPGAELQLMSYPRPEPVDDIDEE